MFSLAVSETPVPLPASRSVPKSPVGAWLSLVEHLVRDQGVGGSNPLAPTIFPSLRPLLEGHSCDTHRIPSSTPWRNFA